MFLHVYDEVGNEICNIKSTLYDKDDQLIIPCSWFKNLSLILYLEISKSVIQFPGFNKHINWPPF